VPGFGYHGPEDALLAAQQQDLDEEIERLASAGTSIWLLQCNPDKFDIHGMLADGDVPLGWSVSRYLDDIREGDRVVFWISGRQAGVYALGEVVGPPQSGTSDPAYTGHDGPAWDMFVPIDLTVELWDTPILRTALKADPRFAEESIIKIPAAANPHPLSARAFEAIIESTAR
jgi:predicted RNA-binding protein with PUA-like domain